MKKITTSLLSSSVGLFLFLTCFFGCSDHLGFDEIVTSPQEGPISTGSNTYSVGSYTPCFQEYNLSRDYTIDDTCCGSTNWRNGFIYYPTRGGCQVKGKFPLVMIMHADGTNLDTYKPLMQNIAAQGFIVVGYRRNSISGDDDDQEDGQKLFYNHIKYAYTEVLINGIALGNFVNGDLALVGHSAGASTITKLLGGEYDPSKPSVKYGAGFNLKAIVSMSPVIYPDFQDKPHDLSQYVNAFLGFCVADDADGGAQGNKNPNQVMQTAFKHYDEFSSGSKEMIFFDRNVGLLGHYYQQTEVAKSYITAFLRLHVKGEGFQNAFFKYQQRPSSVGGEWDIRQLSWSDNYTTLANFQIPNDLLNGIGGVTIHPSSLDFTNYASIADPYSPHNTKALKINWNNQNEVPSLEFRLPASQSMVGKYFSFNVSQLFDGNNVNQLPKNFMISVTDSDGLESPPIAITDAGGELEPPILNGALTKNAMRAYIIRFSKFANVKLDSIVSIKFSFAEPNSSGEIILDNVAITN